MNDLRRNGYDADEIKAAPNDSFCPICRMSLELNQQGQKIIKNARGFFRGQNSIYHEIKQTI